MAEVTTLARPYAEAVFKLADQANALGNWSTILARFSSAATQAGVRDAIGDPKATTGQLVDLFGGVVDGGAPAEVKNFLTLLAANGRLALLPQISAIFEDMKHRREGVLEAEIASAFPLEAAQLGTLVRDLEAKYKRKIQPHVTVDKELIGGVKIVIGDEVIDASVRGKLQHMATALTT
jgi:F-type H+-transporting ATPase subunit delta